MTGTLPRNRIGDKSKVVAARKIGALIAAMLASALIAACDSSPTATPVSNNPVTSTPPIVATATTGASAPTATVTNTAVPFATATPVPPTSTPTTTPSPTASPTATDAPLPTYTWKPLNLPDGTNLRDVAVLPGDKNVVLLGSPAGIWQSEYDYSVWNKLNIKIPGNPPPGNVELAIGSPTLFYATAHTGCASGLPIASYRSSDGGKTWDKMTVELLDLYAASPIMAYGTTCTGVVKTTDAGATWSDVLPGSQEQNSDPYAITGSPDGKSVYVAYASEGGTGTIQRSTDSGATWKDITPKNLPPDQLLHAAVQMMYATGSVGRPQDGGLYMANQQGTFFLPSETDDWQIHVDAANAIDSPGYYVTAFYVDTDYSDDYVKSGPILYEGRAQLGQQAFEGIGVFRSANLGATWQMIGDDMGKKTVQSLVLAPHDAAAVPGMLETLIAATNNGALEIMLDTLK